MSTIPQSDLCDQAEAVAGYALHSLPDAERAALERHLESCARCKRDLESLRKVVGTFAAWPTDVLRPEGDLWARLARRVAEVAGEEPRATPPSQWRDPDWREVSPGIFCKLLANDTQRHRVSMLVRLLPNVEYPPHTHAGLEELHLLDGELWIDDRKLLPGDYNRAEAPTSDQRVWSETGCTCVLVTSTQDILG